MNIFICEEVGVGSLCSVIIDHVERSGNNVTNRPGMASFGIGFHDSDFGQIRPENRIIFNIWSSPNGVCGHSNLINPGTMKMIPGGASLCDWLTGVKDPLDNEL